jgi:hypothetical protein
MAKKKKPLSSSAMALIAAIEKEMQMPRLANSVRNHKSYRATLITQIAHSMDRAK